MLYGPDDRILENTTSPYFQDPGLRGGWQYAGHQGMPTELALGLNPDAERRKSRVMYYLNPLLGGAADICSALLVGDALTYGEVIDKKANLALEELFAVNNLSTLIPERWMPEFMMDGEQCTVFNTRRKANRDEPSILAFLDVDRGFSLEADTAYGGSPSDMVYEVSFNSGDRNEKRTWREDEFVWTAAQAHFNTARGWPILARAADAALSYIALLNYRVKIQSMQSRILGVHKTFVNTAAPDGGRSQWEAAKVRFGNIPNDGGIMILAQDPRNNTSETLEFLKMGQGASDAETDARALLRLVGMTLGGLPEHWLGEGGNTNRSTAEKMSAPALAIGKRRQNALKGYLDRIMRIELKRRFGPDQTYRLLKSVLNAKTLKRELKEVRVKADMMYFPWNLPDLGEHSLQDALNRATISYQLGLASAQTLSASIGFDPAEESERMGDNFGKPNSGEVDPRKTPNSVQGGQNTQQTPASDPNGNPNGASDPTKTKTGQPTVKGNAAKKSTVKK